MASGMRADESPSLLFREPPQRLVLTSRDLRLALWCGVAYALLQLGAVVYFTRTVMSNKPPVDASTAQHAAFYAEHADQLVLGNWLLTLPVPLFLIFLGGLYVVLRRIEGTGPLSVAALVAGAAVAVTWPFGALLSDAGVVIARAGGSAPTIWALDTMGPYSLALTALPRSVLLGAASAVLWQSDLVPRWIPAVGLVLVPVMLIGSATPVAAALFPFAAFGSAAAVLWVLALSVTLLRAK